MKLPKLLLLLLPITLAVLPALGCGSSENKVIEAPADEQEDTAIPGMTDEDYDKAMDEAMK